MTKYIVVKRIGNIGFPIFDELGNPAVFDSELEADIERIYLQPDYTEKLQVTDCER